MSDVHLARCGIPGADRCSFLSCRLLGIALLICLALLPDCSGQQQMTSGPPASPYHPNGSAPTTQECLRKLKRRCYNPEQIQEAYDLTPLLRRGDDGHGQTIVLAESFGSPTLRHDLQTFDTAFGLPAPPRFQILYPLGMPTVQPNNKQQQGWAAETTLDVEWAHAIAPGASITVLVNPVGETGNGRGLADFLRLYHDALNNHLGNVFSESWGIPEPVMATSAGRQFVRRYDALYSQASRQGATFFVAAGDTGATSKEPDGSRLYPHRTINWPASDPQVTAVGGTELLLNPANGAYEQEIAWNDRVGATGGGVSILYSEPTFQQGVNGHEQNLLDGHRGIPDVAWSAQNFLLYLTLLNGKGGWIIAGGTSAGAPAWAGLMAIADQMAGHPLGNINAALYTLAGTGFHDITQGNNSIDHVEGYSALPGWDLVTGWGTPDVAVLLPQLIQAAKGR